MNDFFKRNINIIISIFILLQPIIDLITGMSLHLLNIDFTAGIVVKALMLLIIMYISLFIYKKKKLLIPYLAMLVYFILYTVGMIMYKDNSLFIDMQYLFKTFYFPILLISLYSLRDEIRISKMILFKTLFIYIILIFIPTIFNVGYKTYEITKAGTIGFYSSANEISGIISILTPIIFIIFTDNRNYLLKVILALVYFIVILTMGTKTPLLSLFITILFALIYLIIKCLKNKNYKPIIYSFLSLLLIIISLLYVIPKTNFYKNIETHLNYLKVDNIGEIFTDEKLVDHFIFSQRLTFLNKKAKIYNKSPLYEKLFGIGYVQKNKMSKLIEMDYFDIFYSHGIIGFIIFFSIVLSVIYNVLKKKQVLSYDRYMMIVSFILIIFLSFFTGHIITAPSVSLISAIIILSLNKREKLDLLFTAVSLDIGGIEKSLVNLVNRIDQKKYNIDIILEEKKGIFLDKVNKNISIKEIKVNKNSNILVRKTINFLKKAIYKLFNYKNYDYSCCYATYSYSSSKLALNSSNNTCFYVHNDYRNIYKNEYDFREFFDSRNIRNYKNIIFVSNESKKGFIEIYKDLENKCKVFNNFIDVEEIIKLSEEIKITRENNHIVLLYVGRLDEYAKRISRQINLIKNISNLDLWIIGDGPNRKIYEKQVKENNLQSRITFFGKKSNPFPYMKEADFIILTSDYEGFPVTYLESIALNKNIITTFPTSDDTIDIRNYAYVVDSNDEKMLEEVKKIIKNRKANNNSIDLNKSQKNRMKQLEKMFDGVI